MGDRFVGIPSRHEPGVILILLALGIVTVFTVLGVIIEITRVTAAQEKAQSVARLAALAALEAYYTEFRDCTTGDTPQDPAACHPSSVTAAQGGIAKVLENNSGGGADFNADFGPESELALTFGTWSDQNCDAGKDLCFTELQNGADPFEKPNAIVFSGPAGSLNPTNFSFPFWKNIMNINVSATATLTPRRVVFVVDISNSAVRESFPKWVRNPDPPPDNTYGTPIPKCGQGHEFAFPLSLNVGGSGTGTPITSLPPPEDLDGTYFPASTNYLDKWNFLVNNFPTRGVSCGPFDIPSTDRDTEWQCPTSSGAITMPYYQCASDYVYKRSFGDEDYDSYAFFGANHPDPAGLSVGEHGRWYLVNGRESGVTAPGEVEEFQIEPFNSIIVEALRKALDDFAARKVVGDRAALIFHDDTLNWLRMTKLTENFQYLKDLVDLSVSAGGLPSDFASGSGDLDEADAKIQAYGAAGADGTGMPESGLERMIRFQLIPDASGFTDPFIGVQQALNMFAAASTTGAQTSDFIVVVTDGFANCIHCSLYQDPQFTNEYEHSGPSNECTINPGQAQVCNDSFEYHSDAMKDLYQLAKLAIERKVPIHVLLIESARGVIATQKISEILNPGGFRCINDRRFREKFTTSQRADIDDFAWQGDTSSAGSTQNDEDAITGYSLPGFRYYRLAREWYPIAALTKGVFAPVRTPPVYNFCTLLDTDGRNHTLCTGSSPITTDPYCRTRSRQVADYVEQIIGTIPFSIVDN